MTAIRPAVLSDADAVTEFLYTHMSSKIPRDRWRRLFDYPWRPPDAPDYGRVIEDKGRLVGYVGAIYADRPLGEGIARFCNLTSWYMFKEYRGRGRGWEVITDLVSDDAYTYTGLTSTDAVVRLFQGSGLFRIMDDRRYLLRRRTPAGDQPEVRLVEEGAALLDRLTPGQRVIHGHHQERDVRHLVFEAGGRSSYLVLHVKKKSNVAYHEVLHVADPGLLAAHAPGLADRLLPPGAAVLAIDRRLVPEAPEGAVEETLPQPRQIRSSTLEGPEIDNLYNEIFLLDLKLP